MKDSPSQNRGSAVLLALVALAILGAIGAYFYFVVYKLNVPSIGNLPIPGMPSVNVKLPRYFVDCNDPRQVIEEGNLLYTGCLGGVLVVDKTTGEVRDQLGLPDGLSDLSGNSIVKKGDVLYIGSQDGITIFNLKTRSAKKVSVKEGLVNGSNIQLFEDGDNIWIATFDGVSLLDTKTNTLTNYTTQLDPGAEKRNIPNMLLTDKYVYFEEVASAYAAGAITRYDRATKTFKVFGPSDFGETGQYARIDFNHIGNFKNFVFVSESSKLFMIDEQGDDTWKKVESPFAFVKTETGQDFNSLNVLRNTDLKGILLTSGNKIYRYIPSSDSTEVVHDFGKNFTDILYRNEGNKIWIRPTMDSGNWLSALDLTTDKITNYALKDRPTNPGVLLALIDDDGFFESGVGILKYSLKDNVFTKLFDSKNTYIENFLQPAFLPLPGTNQIFVLRQVCGQGCEKPLAQIYDYPDGNLTEVVIPQNVLDLISTQGFGGGTMYQALTFSYRDSVNADIGMSTPTEPNKKFAVYNWLTKSWRIVTEVPAGATNFENKEGVICNRVYSFKSNGNKFAHDDCTGKAENDSFSWSLADNKLKELNKKTSSAKFLSTPFLDPNYSPFGTVSNPRINGIMYAEGKLWISSDRGLIAYNPADSSYKLYGPSEGLLSKDVTSFLLGKYLWVISSWGGLSILQP